jgi:hypothetical protein
LAHHATVRFFNDIFDEAGAEAAVDFVVELKSWTFLSVEEFVDGTEADLILSGGVTLNPDSLF